MIDKLLELHSKTHPQPRLAHADGMAVVQCDKHTIQFDRDAGALFYLEAHRVVPSLCARIRELEVQIASNALEAARRELEAALETVRVRETRIRDLEQQLTDVSTARTIAEQKAKQGLEAQRTLHDLALKVKAINGALTPSAAPDSK